MVRYVTQGDSGLFNESAEGPLRRRSRWVGDVDCLHDNGLRLLHNHRLDDRRLLDLPRSRSTHSLRVGESFFFVISLVSLSISCLNKCHFLVR